MCIIHNPTPNHCFFYIIKEGYELDYIVGSVHHVDGIPIDFNEELYTKAETKHKTTEKLFIAYFTSLYTLLDTLKPTVIGHFDLIRIHRQEIVLNNNYIFQ